MIRVNRSRWALSFADLCLLMLGFFVLLQADQATRRNALSGIGTYFGELEAPRQTDLAAHTLFEPGEALLSETGHAALLRATRPLAASSGIVQVQSIGLDKGLYRFDAWDLAAARLGAVARALVAAGLAPDRLRIVGLAEQADRTASAGQTIRIVQVASGGD